MKRTATARRLEKAARSAEALAAARAEEASKERRRLIASWNVRGRIPEHLATTPEAEIDEQIIIMSQECLYQYERQHGPVRALLPTPDLTAEEWATRTEEEVAGYAKGIVTEGVTPEWKRPRQWLMTEDN